MPPAVALLTYIRSVKLSRIFSQTGTAMGRAGCAQFPVLLVKEPKKDGCAHCKGAHAWQKPNPLVTNIYQRPYCKLSNALEELGYK